MTLDIERHLRPTIDWVAARYLDFSLSDMERAELIVYLDKAYEIAKTKEKKEGDLWEHLLFRAVCLFYRDRTKSMFNSGHQWYKGFMCGPFDTDFNDMIDALILISRENMENYRSMMNSVWGMEFYPDAASLESEFLDWFTKKWGNRMAQMEEYRKMTKMAEEALTPLADEMVLRK